MTSRRRLSPAFRFLLLFLPKQLRREHEDELRQFLELETPGDRTGRVRYWFATLFDVLRASPSAHVDILRQDLGLAVRQLRRAPGYGILASGTLAVGIAGNVALFTVVDHTLIEPPPFMASDRLVTLSEEHVERGLLRFGVSPANYRDFMEGGADLIEAGTAWQTRSGTVMLGETPDRVSYAAVSAGFFQVFHEPPVVGRSMRPGDDVPGADGVVVSHSFWTSRLGADPAAVGRVFSLDGTRRRVIGVMPERFAYPNDGIQLWTALGLPESEWSRRGARFLGATLRLRDGVEPARLHERLNATAATLAMEYPDTNEGWGTSVLTLQEARTSGIRTPLMVVWMAAVLILLIAVANVANLLLGRAVARREEMALRRALGACSSRLVRQTLTEGAVLATLGGGLGLALAGLLLYQLRRVAIDVLPRVADIALDPRAMAFAAGLTVVVTLMFSVVPAWLERGTGAGAGLRTRGTARSMDRARLQTRFVIGEIALAVVVSVGAGLLARSAVRLLEQPLGYVPEQVATYRVEPPIRVDPNQPMPMLLEEFAADRVRIADRYEAYIRSLRDEPGIVEAGAVSRLPLTGNWWITGFDIPASPSPDDDYVAYIRVVSPGYLSTMQTSVLEGRGLRPTDVAGAEMAVVIDETFARRYWGERDPLGEVIHLDGPPDADPISARVVGIVESVRQATLESEPRPTFYVTLAQASEGHGTNWGMDIVLRYTGVPPSEQSLRRITRSFLPGAAVFRVMSMEDLVSASFASRRFQLTLFGGFSALALLLTMVGVFGVLALYVRERTREFGVRLALGATPWRVRWLVQRNALASVAWGSAIGLTAAVLMARLFESLVYGISAYDPISFLGGPIVLGLVALGGGMVPAWHATRTDPATVLRGE